jgi:hypothetical protein
MIITTQKGAKFDTDKPARSNICCKLDDRGRKVPDKLRVTGRMTTAIEFHKPISMIEVETSFEITEVHEDFLWQ